MLSKIKILILAIAGEILKKYYNIFKGNIEYGINTLEDRSEKVIVSLTSYGRRVSEVLPFTIISLLKQTYKPDVLLLWLDSDNWNDNNIPNKLKELKQYGLTIKYYKDIKSYKKIVPTLELYPNDLIVTCDDDIYYRSSMVEKLINEYRKDSNCIYAHRAHLVGLDTEGNLKPYNDWEEEISGDRGRLIFPTSGGGCLYKKSLLYRDVCDQELFLSLAPKADDVWLYFMGLLQGTTNVVLPYKGYIYIPLDVFYQHFHKDSNLSNYNCKESLNDKQINNVMSHYKIKINM